MAAEHPAAAPSGGWLEAGFVGRPHGLDGSFHVNVPRPRLLELGAIVTVGGQRREIVRLAATPARPVLRLEGVEDRDAAELLRGQPLLVAAGAAPPLAAGEFWGHELEGCVVGDGAQELGVVRRMIELPSCEALEVVRPDGRELLVPMVRDAIREIDVAARRIDVDAAFLGADPAPDSGAGGNGGG
jgi:16S rRNA processing protein RimM